MITKKRVKIVIMIYVGNIIVCFIPSVPAWIRAAVVTVLSFGTLEVHYMLYNYYGSIIQSKKTILTYLMQLVMAVGAVSVIWFAVSHAVWAIPSFITFALDEENAGVTCHLLAYEVLDTIPFVWTLMTVIFSKMALILNSMAYMDLDHERCFKQSLLLISCLSIGECVVWLINQGGTLCIKSKLDRILAYAGLTTEYKPTEVTPVLQALKILLFACAMFVLLALERWRKRRPVKKEGVTELPSLPEIPRVTDYNLRVLRGEFLQQEPATAGTNIPAVNVESSSEQSKLYADSNKTGHFSQQKCSQSAPSSTRRESFRLHQLLTSAKDDQPESQAVEISAGSKTRSKTWVSTESGNYWL